MSTNKQDRQPIVRDRQFEPGRRPRSDAAKGVVKEAIGVLEEHVARHGLRKRARRAVDQQTFEATVTALVSDLIYREVTGDREWITISLSKEVLGRRGRYHATALNTKLPQLLEWMADPELKMVEMEKGHQGFFGSGKRTRIRAATWLLEKTYPAYDMLGIEDFRVDRAEEVIILKQKKDGQWDKGDWIDYRDTKTTKTFREEVEKVNRWLSKADITFDRSFEGVDNYVDVEDRFLRRYFNNGTFDQGGRLFGGFWQPLSKDRRHGGIRINRQSVVTLDYSQMAPRILYSMAGVEFPEKGAYYIPGLESHRAGVKKVFNALLFADKPLTRFPHETRSLFPSKIKFPQVLEQLTTAHERVSRLFFSGIGFKIMFTESQIMVGVLLGMMKEGIVGLPVHDAVVVPTGSVDVAMEIMRDVFMAHTHTQAVVSIEH